MTEPDKPTEPSAPDIRGAYDHHGAFHATTNWRDIDRLRERYQNGAPEKCCYEFNEFSHFGKFGDLIYGLAAVKEWLRSKSENTGVKELARLWLYPRDVVNGTWEMDQRMFEVIRPLLERQPYLDLVEWSPSVVRCNLTGWWDWQNKARSIPGQHARTLGVDVGEWMYQPWLEVDEPDAGKQKDVVINWTPRYPGWMFPWKQVLELIGKYSVFVGLREEYDQWSENTGNTTVPYAGEVSYYDACRMVAGSKLFVGSQSSLLSVAAGLRKPRLIEPANNLENCDWGGPECLSVHSDTPVTSTRINQLLKAYD